MVSFQCEGCGDIFTKKKLDQHFNRCRAPFTCIDCMMTFQGTSWRSHTSCMSEAQKYQGALYKEPKKNNTQPKPQSQPKPSHQPYVESASSSSNENAQAITHPRTTVPPPAPSPPGVSTAEAEVLNVHDYIKKDRDSASSKKDKKRKSHSDDAPDYSYGTGPVPVNSASAKDTCSFSSDSATATPLPRTVTLHPLVTVPTSDKKRKRSDAAPSTETRPTLLRSGLTGGLQRMVTDENNGTMLDQSTPLAETKRGKRQKNDESSRQREEDIEEEIRRLERKKDKAARRARIEGGEEKKMLEYGSPSAANGKSASSGRGEGGVAEGFLRIVKDERKSSARSSKGQSVWGALKMLRDDEDGEVEEKKLWKGLRMKVNDKGEVVLYAKDN